MVFLLLANYFYTAAGANTTTTNANTISPILK